MTTTADPRGGRFWVGWYALTLALLALVPAAKWNAPFWTLRDAELQAFLLLAGAFLASALVPSIRLWRGKPMRAGNVLLWTLALFSVVWLWLVLSETHAARQVTAEIVLLAVVLLPLSFGLRRGRGWILLGLAAAICLHIASILYAVYGPVPTAQPRIAQTFIKTAFYNLEVNSYEGRIPAPAARGGGLARIADQYLLATGDGHLYLFGWRGNGSELTVKSLPFRVPINGEEFAASVSLPYERPRGNVLAGDATGSQVDTWRFHVSDILVQELGAKLRLFAGHHYWNKAQRCYITRVSMAESDRAAFMDGSAKLAWKTLYESKPCLPIEGPLRDRLSPFQGNFSGGRLALLDPDSLLFTVGFHGFDGVNSAPMFSQDPQASWGTVVLIHVDGATSETFSTGHRNQQGLYIDPKGEIWETEQGPEGGDELNILKRGVNYGWPFVTYGTNYDSLIWPLSKTQGRHDGYPEAVFAWLPDIGVSNLISVERDLFPVWKGDLLVGSLRAQTLFRVRIVDRRVVFVEPIEIGQRIRALLEGVDGRIVLWTDRDAIVSIKPATTTSGELLFANACGGCHKALNGRTHIIGPDLGHVYGRAIASAEGYSDYSAALKGLSGRWDSEKLDKFLANPQAFAPGTRMPFAGIADASQRAAIIKFLKSLN
jgi:cytochrome c2